MPFRRLLQVGDEAHPLAVRITQRLRAFRPPVDYPFMSPQNLSPVSAVLFLLSPIAPEGRRREGTDLTAPRSQRDPKAVYLILNKRSSAVRQAGDLCCPGGGISPLMDRFWAALLRMPDTPLTPWSLGAPMRRRGSTQHRRMTLLLATALREGFEEMRLNPLGVRFLGPLPAERLVIFRKEIYPFVVWVGRQRQFRPNWEVADLVYLPLDALLNPANYARLHYRFSGADNRNPDARPHHNTTGEMPCYLHGGSEGVEVLWGATYRITMRFLEQVFDFKPPSLAGLPIVARDLDANYVNGKGSGG